MTDQLSIIPSFYVNGLHSPLSNFYPHAVLIDGHVWHTTEHYYQAMKTLDEDQRTEIRENPSPGQAKRLGRRVTLRDDWEAIKLLVMQRALENKFNYDTEQNYPARYLIKTGDALLVEGNNWGDRFWGVDNGAGENWLGVLLMARRAVLRYERLYT